MYTHTHTHIFLEPLSTTKDNQRTCSKAGVSKGDTSFSA